MFGYHAISAYPCTHFVYASTTVKVNERKSSLDDMAHVEDTSDDHCGTLYNSMEISEVYYIFDFVFNIL